jgi:hypothetical protein
MKRSDQIYERLEMRARDRRRGPRLGVVHVDCDVLLRTNLYELKGLLDDSKAVMCVKHDHRPSFNVKMDGREQCVGRVSRRRSPPCEKRAPFRCEAAEYASLFRATGCAQASIPLALLSASMGCGLLGRVSPTLRGDGYGFDYRERASACRPHRRPDI